MEHFRSFLESSTIHGLSYISTTGKYVRLFWILVVLSGFAGAGIIIYQSFEAWDESPVKTTIETRPISEITFPVVTVCPPKNTFTDLNHDLMILQNMTLDNSTRMELVNYATELLYDQLYENIMANFGLLDDNDRYYNWYHGSTKLNLGYYSARLGGFKYDIESYASSGTIFTRYFDKKFDPEKVDKNVQLMFKIKTHNSVGFNPNLTLHMKIEKITIKEFSSDTGKDEFVFKQPSHGIFVTDKNVFVKNFTPPDDGMGEPIVSLNRAVTLEDVNKQTLEAMPGFKLTWHFSGMPVEEHGYYYSSNFATRAFVRLANLFQMTSLNLKNLWIVVRKIKLFTTLDKKCRIDGLFKDHTHILNQVKRVEENLQIKSSQVPYKNMTSKHLGDAAKMLIYLSTCPGVDTASAFNAHPFEKWFKRWNIFFKNLLEIHSPDHIILTLNRLTKNNFQNNQKGKIILQKIFKRAAFMFHLEYEAIQNILPGKGKNIHFQDKSQFNNKSDYTYISHPVHIVAEDNQISPTAFIPFCEFGGDMSSTGVKFAEFEIPVCNSFQAKILNDQLCYEVDLNKFSNKENIDQELELGFSFLMDYNEDRQVTFDQNFSNAMKIGLAATIVETDTNKHASIYLNTIEPIKLAGEGEYNLNVLKEIKATSYYLGLDKKIRDCQFEESLHNCTTRNYLDTFLEKCGCLPFNVRLQDKEPICSSSGLKCVEKIKLDTSSCLKPCSGLIVTSFYKSERQKNLDDLFPIYGAYNIFKKITQNPSGYSEFEWKNKLRFVRIYFDTPTFDRITQDRAAKFVDMLSAIGGTMGLLSGFSIISAVEILYFVAYTAYSLIRKKRH